MDFNIEIRKKQLENLDQVISSSRERINSILKFLDWTEDKVQHADNLVHCPIDPNHRIPPNCWNNHIEKCLLKREGYNSNEQFLSESLTDPTQSIYIDQHKKVDIIRKELMENPSSFRPENQCRCKTDRHNNNSYQNLDYSIIISFLDILFFKVLFYLISYNKLLHLLLSTLKQYTWNGLEPDPRTSNRYIATYSPDERLAFYNYTIENTTGPQTPPEFTTIIPKKATTDKSLSYKELLAMERDAKRRRIKHRSVHINKKNHTEIMREVINNQMDEYQEYLLERERKENHKEIDDERNSNERPNSSISRHSTHSGSSTRKHDDIKDTKYKDRDRYTRDSHRNGEKSKRSSRRSYDDDYDYHHHHHRRRRRSRSYDRRKH